MKKANQKTSLPVLSFGRYKGRHVDDVPAAELISIFHLFRTRPEMILFADEKALAIYEYIDEHIDDIRKNVNQESGLKRPADDLESLFKEKGSGGTPPASLFDPF